MIIDQIYKEVSQAHYSVMQSTELMELYIDEHLAIIREESNGRTDEWVMKQHKQQSTTWLKDQNIPIGETWMILPSVGWRRGHRDKSQLGKLTTSMGIHTIPTQRIVHV